MNVLGCYVFYLNLSYPLLTFPTQNQQIMIAFIGTGLPGCHLLSRVEPGDEYIDTR